jgi:hypothetical protein
MIVRLDCPLCGFTVLDGPDPAPGVCAGCGARFDGNAETSAGAVEALLVSLSRTEIDGPALTRALFELDGESDLARQVAIASDRREGFYNWWVFVRTDGMEIGTLLRRVLASG